MNRVEVYPIERPAVPQLAQLMHEFVTGKHPAQATSQERKVWIDAMDRLLGVLVDTENVALTGMHWSDPRLREEEPE